tara:strand:- start:279 stop:785 length:507 start_codon:yes stop_codon:yes gene_type:complete
MNNKQSKTFYKLTDKHQNIKSHYVFLQGGSIGCGSNNVMKRLDNYLGFIPQGEYNIVNDLVKFGRTLRSSSWIRYNDCRILSALSPGYVQTQRNKVFKITETKYNPNPVYKIRKTPIKVYKNKYNRRYIMWNTEKIFIKRDQKYIYKPIPMNIKNEVFETTLDEYNMI